MNDPAQRPILNNNDQINLRYHFQVNYETNIASYREEMNLFPKHGVRAIEKADYSIVSTGFEWEYTESQPCLTRSA